MKVVTEWFGHDMATALKHYHQVMPADFERACEQDPSKQAEKVTPKAMPALPRMGENGQAPIKKGIENTVEHGSYQCLMTPTGLEDGVQTLDNTNALVESDAKNDAIYADLIEGSYVHRALVIAGILGAISGSWTIFLIAAGVLVATSVHDGTIRL